MNPSKTDVYETKRTLRDARRSAENTLNSAEAGSRNRKQEIAVVLAVIM